ncbi:MAG: hypothetical protein LM564_04065 [Desulfurococcaceae archaeon]|nr:hypothetical protein [Desulfurococcaceae archaeon]
MAAAPPAAPPAVAPTRLRKAYTTTTSLVIPAKVGERHSIEDILAYGLAAGAYVDVVVGATNMLRLYGNRNDMYLIPPPNAVVGGMGPLEFLRRVTGRTELIYAEEDEDITITFSSAPTIGVVDYFVDPSAKEKTSPFGSQSKERLLIAWVSHSRAINATGNYSLDTPLMPVGLPAVVDQFIVPANYEYHLHGIIFASTKVGSTKPTYLHIWDEGTELFTPYDHKGLLVDPDANLLKCDLRYGYYFKLPEPYVFAPGHKITLNFDAVFDGTNTIAAGTLLLGLILLVRYLG